MDIIRWVFTGLLFSSLFLFIFGSIKNFKILVKISRIFIIPFASCIFITFLQTLLPNSEHILFLSVIALLFISLCELCFSFENISFFKYIGRFFFLLSCCSWIELFISTFYIYRVPQFINITAYILYFLLLVFIFIISGKNKFHTYLGILIGYFFVIFLNYSAVITLIFCIRDYAIFLMAGTTVLLISYIFYVKQFTKSFKISKKLEAIFRICLIVIAEALITTSTIFMIK